MALINILAKSSRTIDWNAFLEDYANLNLFNIEVFPIPKELGFDFDNVGISIHKGYSQREVVLLEVERLIKLFRLGPYYFNFIELYDGLEVHSDNVIDVIGGLLPIPE